MFYRVTSHAQIFYEPDSATNAVFLKVLSTLVYFATREGSMGKRMHIYSFPNQRKKLDQEL